MFHLNAWGAAYLISYLAYLFNCFKHVQNVNLKNLKIFEIDK